MLTNWHTSRNTHSFCPLCGRLSQHATSLKPFEKSHPRSQVASRLPTIGNLAILQSSMEALVRGRNSHQHAKESNSDQKPNPNHLLFVTHCSPKKNLVGPPEPTRFKSCPHSLQGCQNPIIGTLSNHLVSAGAEESQDIRRFRRAILRASRFCGHFHIRPSLLSSSVTAAESSAF
jgi:hypothetical protein